MAKSLYELQSEKVMKELARLQRSDLRMRKELEKLQNAERQTRKDIEKFKCMVLLVRKQIIMAQRAIDVAQQNAMDAEETLWNLEQLGVPPELIEQARTMC
jgi:predicted  nucleic acid-binding Zn-ribbon protein